MVWDLAPHDLSIVDYVLGREARSISAWGCAHADRDIEDIAYVNVDFGDRMLANFHVNWLSPVKVRQMIFAGSRKSLIFNELNTTEPIKVYDRGIELGEGAEERRSCWSATAPATSGARTSSRARRCRGWSPTSPSASATERPRSATGTGLARRPAPGGGHPEHPGPGGPRGPFQRSPWPMASRCTNDRTRPTSSGSPRTFVWEET